MIIFISFKPPGGNKVKDKSRPAEENSELVSHLRAPKLLKLCPSGGDVSNDKISRSAFVYLSDLVTSQK